MDTNLNLNHADCLRTVNNIGGQVVKNICNGTETTVPWGSADWVSAAAISGLVAVMVVILIVCVVMAVRMMFDLA